VPELLAITTSQACQKPLRTFNQTSLLLTASTPIRQSEWPLGEVRSQHESRLRWPTRKIFGRGVKHDVGTAS
jgi:hypothetical protein